jgi:hypothetical protein
MITIEKIKNFWRQLWKSRDFLIFLLAVCLAPLLERLVNSQVAIWIFAVVLSLVVLVTWTMAGFIVFRSLFFVSAGLSLMIFLAQSYCGLPQYMHTADVALQSLMGFGIIYLAVNSKYIRQKGDGEEWTYHCSIKGFGDLREPRALLD